MSSTKGSSVSPRLHVDRRYLDPSPGDLGIASAIMTKEAFAEHFARRQTLVDDAVSLGFEVIKGAQPETLGPDEYVVRSNAHDDAADLADLREVLPDMSIPKTVDFSTYDAQPFFPVVAKITGYSQGVGKYLIETPEQYAKLRNVIAGQYDPLRTIPQDLLDDYNVAYETTAQYQPGDPLYEPALEHRRVWDRALHTYEYPFQGRKLTKDFEFQEYIETPSDHFTSYRVVVAATGEILASSLYYSRDRVSDAQIVKKDIPIEQLGRPGCDILDALEIPESLGYLGSRQFQSNHARGARGIVLGPASNPKPRDPDDVQILIDHGIDPKHPELPQQLRELASTIAKTIGRSRSIVLGIDFLQQEGTNKFFYIETNESPGPVAYAEAHLGDLNEYASPHTERELARAALRSIANAVRK